jgi:formyl-CoA transferase
VALLEQAGVPCGLINNLAQVFGASQVKARGMKIESPHPSAGTVPLMASPMRLSATPVEYRLPPPLLGQHTREVLESVLGPDAARIGELERERVIGV